MGILSRIFRYAIAESYTKGYNALSLKEEKEQYIVTTSKLHVHVAKADMRIGIYDLEGNVLLEDELGFHWKKTTSTVANMKMSKFSPDGENFYGLGDKPMHSNLKGKCRKLEHR